MRGRFPPFRTRASGLAKAGTWEPRLGGAGTRDSGLGTGEKPAIREASLASVARHAEGHPKAATSRPRCFFESRVPSPESRLPRRRRGFTLIEVLAAIALLAIAFAVALGALGKSAQNAARSTALDAAVERAQTLLAEQGLAAPLKAETLSGHFDDGTAWTLKIHALPRPRPAPDDGDAGVALQQGGVMMAQATAIDLYQLDVAVQYGAGRTLRLSTQRAQAAPNGNRE